MEINDEDIGRFKYPCDGCGKNRCNVKVTMETRLIVEYCHRYFYCDHSFCRVCMQEHFSAHNNNQQQSHVGNEAMQMSQRTQHFTVKCLKSTCNALANEAFKCDFCHETLPKKCMSIFIFLFIDVFR